MATPDFYGMTLYPGTINPSDYELAITDPWLYFLRRRLRLVPRLERSEALSRGSYLHKFFEVDGFSSPYALLEQDLRAKTADYLKQKRLDLSKAMSLEGLTAERRTEILQEEVQDYEVALAMYISACAVKLPGDYGGGSFRDWLGQPKFKIIARETRFDYPNLTDENEPRKVGVLDLLIANTATKRIFIIDLKSTSYSPRDRAVTCPLEFQTLHYLWSAPQIMQELIDKDLTWSDYQIGGLCHLILQKPTIEFCGADRNFTIDTTPLKSGPRKGEPKNEKKYYGEPVLSNYIKRVKNWMLGTEDYLHLAPERNADPCVNISTTPMSAAFARQADHAAAYCAFRNVIMENDPRNFPVITGNLLARGEKSPYLPFYFTEPSEWLAIARANGFRIGKEIKDAPPITQEVPIKAPQEVPSQEGQGQVQG